MKIEQVNISALSVITPDGVEYLALRPDLYITVTEKAVRASQTPPKEISDMLMSLQAFVSPEETAAKPKKKRTRRKKTETAPKASTTPPVEQADEEEPEEEFEAPEETAAPDADI